MAPASEASSQERQLPQQGAEEPTDLWEAGMGNSLLAGLPGACRVPMCIQPPQVRLKTGHPAGPHLNLRSLPGAKTATSLPTAQVSCSQPASSGATFLPAGAISVQTESRDTCDQDREEGMLPAFCVLCGKRTLCLTMAQTFTERTEKSFRLGAVDV